MKVSAVQKDLHTDKYYNINYKNTERYEVCMNVVYSFFNGTEWYVYAVIFLAKILEISLSTLRIILINREYHR